MTFYRHIFLLSFLFISCQGGMNGSDSSLKVIKGYYFSESGGKHLFHSHMRGSYKIALTYDDFYSEEKTPLLLDLLAKYNVKATFFFNTKKAYDPASPVIQRIIKEGHILASHNQDHLASTTNNGGHFVDKLTKSALLIEKAYQIARENGIKNGSKTFGTYFRYPFGKKNSTTYRQLREVGDNIYGENCINYVFWDIDTLDWKLRNANKVFKNIVAQLEGGRGYDYSHGRAIKVNFRARHGGVILMHDLGDAHHSYEATEKLLKWVQDYPYEFVPLSSVEDFSFDDRRCEVLPGLLDNITLSHSSIPDTQRVKVVNDERLTLWRKDYSSSEDHIILAPYAVLEKGAVLTYKRSRKLNNVQVLDNDGYIVDTEGSFYGYILVKEAPSLRKSRIRSLNKMELFIKR